MLYVKFAPKVRVEAAPTQAYTVGDMEFTSRTGSNSEGASKPKSDSSQPEPAPTAASIPIKREMLTPVAKPTETRVSDIAPQPAVTETKIEIDKEKQDWEV